MNEPCYYFGCYGRGQAGHYLWLPGMMPAKGVVESAFIRLFDGLDGVLCPGGEEVRNYGPARQPEGEARIHRRERDGISWTALAFWDRSVDSRFGSNSVFIARGARTFEEMCSLAEGFFLEVWKRFPFAVRLAGAPAS